jgi:hypothetical protein
VYGKAEDASTPLNLSPVTLILHGNDGQTWLTIGEGPRQKSDGRLVNAIEQRLEVNAPELKAP